MSEPLGLLCILVVVLGAVAVIGHGIWLAAAALGRFLFGDDRAETSRPLPEPGRPELCARCGQPLRLGQTRCPRCKLHRASPAAAELRDLEVMARQVQRFLDSGGLDRDTCERLYRSIRASALQVIAR